jgi:TonB family protein
MNTALISLTALAAFASNALPTDASADTCQPKIVTGDTSFPMRSQLRGQEGTVFMDVTVDAHGRAADVHLVDSSGYRLLDRAAEQSVLEGWEFDVSACERKDLPIKHRIAVEYRNEEYR